MVSITDVVGTSSIKTVVYVSMGIGLVIGVLGTFGVRWIIKKVKDRKKPVQTLPQQKPAQQFPQEMPQIKQDDFQPYPPRNYPPQMNPMPQQQAPMMSPPPMPPQYPPQYPQQRPQTQVPQQRYPSQYEIDQQQQMEMEMARQEEMMRQQQQQQQRQPMQPQQVPKDDEFADFLQGYQQPGFKKQQR